MRASPMARKIPPLNPLRAFEVSARHMSFTKAAEELFVTSSAVSHQVKSLEENLGIALFVRDSKILTLTPAGKAYLPGVQEAFRQLEVATYQLHREKSTSLLKINLPPTFAVKWLIPRLSRFSRQHPDLDLKVSTSKLMADFSRDAVDMEIRYGRGVYAGLYSELVLPVEVFAVCSPALQQGPHPIHEFADLRYHVLLHDDSTYDDVSNPNWGTWLAHMGVHDLDATRGPSFWPSHLVIDAAIDGQGVALVKKSWVSQDLASGKLVRLFPKHSLPIEFAYYLVFPRNRLEDPRIAAFVDWMREELARDTPA
ncbi:transcriptional regulator GcvA [Achromobacter insolitus]|nr:transcriptional regulator GcvA [Achromobacter insolitus]